MNLHEAMAADLERVFFNLDEFACVHEIEGKKIACIVDDIDQMAESGASQGFSNVSGLGLLNCQRVVYFHAADFGSLPFPGSQIEMDGRLWLVADGIQETEGMAMLPLNRAY